jgi:hypothetical protein
MTMIAAQLGDKISRAGMLVEGKERHVVMGQVAIEYAEGRIAEATKAKDEEIFYYRAALAQIAGMPKRMGILELDRAVALAHSLSCQALNYGIDPKGEKHG